MDAVLKWFIERGYHKTADRSARLYLHLSTLFFLLFLLMLFSSWLPVVG